MRRWTGSSLVTSLALCCGLTVSCSSAPSTDTRPPEPTNEGESSVTQPTKNPSNAPLTGNTRSGKPFKMYTHCGVESAEIRGRWWHADPPLYNKRGSSPPAGWGDPFQQGTLVVESSQRAVFEALGQEVIFVPAPDNEPVRMCD